jgi:hypothetical protein
MPVTVVFDTRPQGETAADDSMHAGSANTGRWPADHLAKIALGFGIAMTLAWAAFLGWCLSSFLNLI